MNKQSIIKLLQEKRTELDSLIKDIAASKAMKTDGRLVSRRINGKTRLYEKTKNGEKYLGSDKQARISILASKAYATKLEEASKLERMQIDKCLQALDSGRENDVDHADIDSVYSLMPEYIRSNCTPSKVTDERFAEKWQEEKYYNRWMKSDYSFETPRGEKVRSKSEWMIACMLAEAGVPYRYEEIVAVSSEFKLFFHPDFTVLNKRTRKVYYWEHFGRMDDPKYIEESFMPKMNDYYNFEFLPGEKLLMTFESKHHPLDTIQVKRLIENYLL